MRALLLITLLLSAGLSLGQFPSFRTAQAPWNWQFPKDHGAHPQFETEWWYLTGQLFAEGKEAFHDPSDYGFQLTFFRRAKASEDNPQGWNQFYSAHVAISDLPKGTFTFDTRLSRAGLGVAGAAPDLFSVWHRDWRLEQFGSELVIEQSAGDKQLRLIGSHAVPKFHGDNGLSRKGSCTTCASYYYSLPRIQLRGEIRDGQGRIPVHGLGWFDHEFMTNTLLPTQKGWDWFSLMFQDGRSLMLFRVRSESPADAVFSGTLFEGDTTHTLGAKDFVIEQLSSWTSPQSKAVYPNRWKLRVPGYGIETELEPRLSGQELRVQGPTGEIWYWEGAVQSSDRQSIGFVEMTGYAQALESIL